MTLPDYARFEAGARRLSVDPRHDAFVQDPYTLYASLHAGARAVFWEEVGLWCFAGYDDVSRLYRDRRLGRARPVGVAPEIGKGIDRALTRDFDAFESHSMLEQEPPTHTRLRTLVNRAFVSRQVERLRPRLASLSHGLIDRIEADGGADLIPSFATPLPVTIIAEMIGVPTADAPQLLDWSHRMVAMYMHGADADTARAANEATIAFSDYIRTEANARRRAPRDDLLTLLVQAESDGQRLSEDELVTNAILLLNAGHEATVHQAANGIRAVLESGLDPARLFADAARAEATVEECIRIDAPLHLFQRHAYETFDGPEGVTIEAGTRIGLLLAAGNRDPATFKEPHRFDPARADPKNLSFGAGIHFCIGAPLARLELQVSLAILFERLPRLRLAGEPRYADTWHFHGLERLEAVW